MKKFTFNLEEILTFRKSEETIAEGELGRALAKEKEIQDNINLLAAQKVTTMQALKGSKSVKELANGTNYLTFLAKQTESLLEDLAAARLVTEEKRAALTKAIQKTTALTKLKEKQFSEYKLELQHEEDNTLDDIITSRI